MVGAGGGAGVIDCFKDETVDAILHYGLIKVAELGKERDRRI
jgi:hypothetical protein